MTALSPGHSEERSDEAISKGARSGQATILTKDEVKAVLEQGSDLAGIPAA